MRQCLGPTEGHKKRIRNPKRRTLFPPGVLVTSEVSSRTSASVFLPVILQLLSFFSQPVWEVRIQLFKKIYYFIFFKERILLCCLVYPVIFGLKWPTFLSPPFPVAVTLGTGHHTSTDLVRNSQGKKYTTAARKVLKKKSVMKGFINCFV